MEQGLIMKCFNIKSLKIITAENDMEIPYVHEHEADTLKTYIHQKMNNIDVRRSHD